MHNLGGVQPDAPHATANFYCWDDNDDMCYDDDGPGPVVMQPVCPGRDTRLFDCGHDDYFLAGTAKQRQLVGYPLEHLQQPFLIHGTVTETYSGPFNSNQRSITHSFASGPGTITATVNGPASRSVTATLVAPDGSTLGLVSGRGTRNLSVTGPARGTHRLVMTGSAGTYTATLRHPI
ncbi:MAG: hypothetical protein LC749_06210 [Actinobacteria bacterium]|nr:hypothetical protein [Actinomycetota bacterium]